MSCRNPLDPIDVEALAAGADPVVSEGAAAHAAACAPCGDAVRHAQALEGELDRLDGLPSLPANFTDRVLRLRPFSPSERRRFSLWRLPLLAAASIFATGIVVLGVPILSAAEQAGLSAALLGPGSALWRAAARSVEQTARLAPSSFEALTSVLRGDLTGFLLLLLLLPVSFGLKRAVARARSPQ